MTTFGTRKPHLRPQMHPVSRSDTRIHAADVGMTKRFVGTAGSTTFSAASAQIQDAGLPSNFVVGDVVMAQGDNAPDGFYVVIGTGSGYLATDPAPPNGGGGSTVITLRTP